MTVLVVSIVGPFTFYAGLVPVLGPVLPRPEGVPRHAAASYHWKGSGISWTWTRTSEHGCATWMATDSSANVQLLVDSDCEGDRRSGHIAGRGIYYYADYLTVQGYWGWSADIYSRLIVYDAEGMIQDIRPCPYSLSETDLEALRVVADEAYFAAQTDGEKRVLSRVKQRLAVLDGANLASEQHGCTDLLVPRGVPIKSYNAWAGS